MSRSARPHRPTILLAAVLVLFGVALPVSVPAQKTDTLVLNMRATDEYPRNSEGAFLPLLDGRIVFAYTQFYGGSADHSTARIVTIESSDNGRSWTTEPKTLVENFGGENIMSVSLLRLADGRIALFYLVKNSSQDCRPHVQFSSDEMNHWTKPKPVIESPGYFVLNNDRVIQLSGGRLVLPVAYHRPVVRNGQKTMDYRAIARWFLSDDNGATWYEADTSGALSGETATGLQEPGVVELVDGSVFCWARTDLGAQYGCRSTDGGKTWSVPDPTSLISPVSPASIKRIPGTTSLFALYNDHSGRFPFAEKKRNPLVAAISRDNGETWPVATVIEPDPNGLFCYTAIHFTQDAVLLSYYAGSNSITDRGDQRIRRISLRAIAAAVR